MYFFVCQFIRLFNSYFLWNTDKHIPFRIREPLKTLSRTFMNKRNRKILYDSSHAKLALQLLKKLTFYSSINCIYSSIIVYTSYAHFEFSFYFWWKNYLKNNFRKANVKLAPQNCFYQNNFFIRSVQTKIRNAHTRAIE